MAEPEIKPSWRKPAGVLAILAWITFWTVLVVTFSRSIGAWPILAQLPLYVIAGVVWILPLKPLMIWIETGRWHP